jgi:NAD(P)-dependent dehydrogenase (short-subunit alcohol dehydrogenase family)
MAKALAANGAKKVYVLGRRVDALEEAASFSPTIVPVQCDVTSKDSLQAAVDRITAEIGYVNLVIANSGVIGPNKTYDPTLSISDLREKLFGSVGMDDFTAAFHVNVTGALFTMWAFLELLDAGNKEALKGGYGAPLTEGGKAPSIQSQVVFTSSISAFMRSYFSSPAYSGSKAAIMHLGKHAASQLAPYGIRVNILAPGCEFHSFLPASCPRALSGDS